MLRLQGEGSGFRPNQVQGARQRIAFRCDEVLPGLRCKPTFELRPQTAEKRDTFHANFTDQDTPNLLEVVLYPIYILCGVMIMYSLMIILA